MANAPLDALLQQTADHKALLPLTAVPLVGALVASHNGIPSRLSHFMMAKLGQRTDMHVVSPVAEAMMRLSAFAKYSDLEFAQLEVRLQHTFLKAIAMDDKVLVAAAFRVRLSPLPAHAVTRCSEAGVSLAGT
jgi:hypothetical protein